MPSKNTTPLEDAEQKTLINHLEYLRLQGKVLEYSAHIDNMFVPIPVAAKAKRLGKRKGYPDITICLASGYLLYVELKREKGSTTYPEQEVWMQVLNRYPQVKAKICYGFKDAEAFIDEFLEPKF